MLGTHLDRVVAVYDSGLAQLSQLVVTVKCGTGRTTSRSRVNTMKYHLSNQDYPDVVTNVATRDNGISYWVEL